MEKVSLNSITSGLVEGHEDGICVFHSLRTLISYVQHEITNVNSFEGLYCALGMIAQHVIPREILHNPTANPILRQFLAHMDTKEDSMNLRKLLFTDFLYKVEIGVNPSKEDLVKWYEEMVINAKSSFTSNDIVSKTIADNYSCLDVMFGLCNIFAFVRTYRFNLLFPDTYNSLIHAEEELLSNEEELLSNEEDMIDYAGCILGLVIGIDLCIEPWELFKTCVGVIWREFILNNEIYGITENGMKMASEAELHKISKVPGFKTFWNCAAPISPEMNDYISKNSIVKLALYVTDYILTYNVCYDHMYNSNVDHIPINTSIYFYGHDVNEITRNRTLVFSCAHAMVTVLRFDDKNNRFLIYEDSNLDTPEEITETCLPLPYICYHIDEDNLEGISNF